MEMWHIWTGLGILFIIFEMVFPTMFFLNFAVGAFIAAVCTLYITDWIPLIIIFAAVSLISLLFLRPMLVKKTTKNQETGINAKYIGKIAKVIEPVSSNSGVISIYDERWQARSQDEIPVGAEVEIISNDSLIMFVQKKELN